MDTENLMTIPEFADLKGCSRQTIYTYIRRKVLKTKKVLGKVFILKCPENDNWIPGLNNGRPKKEK